MMTRTDYAAAYEAGRKCTVRFLLSKGLQEEQALETAQAAWVRGWERRHQLRETDKALRWVNSIALNMYKSCSRLQSQMEEFHEMPVPPALNLPAIDLERMLQKCQPKDRRLLKRRYYDGYDIGEIAKEYHCSRTAIRVRLVRARRRLRAEF